MICLAPPSPRATAAVRRLDSRPSPPDRHVQGVPCRAHRGRETVHRALQACPRRAPASRRPLRCPRVPPSHRRARPRTGPRTWPWLEASQRRFWQLFGCQRVEPAATGPATDAAEQLRFGRTRGTAAADANVQLRHLSGTGRTRRCLEAYARRKRYASFIACRMQRIYSHFSYLQVCTPAPPSK